MAKRNLGIVSKILSDMPAPASEEPKSEETMKKDTLEEKEEKKEATKNRKLKGFYLTMENEVRLKELQMMYLKKGIRVSESELINRAIEEFYLKYKD
jgi:hypothetical protein